MPSIQQTLGNQSWVQANAAALRNMFSITPTKVEMSLLLQVGFRIKVLGVEWRQEDDLPKMLSFLQHLQIIDIKMVRGEAYIAQHLTPAEAEQHRAARAMNKQSEAINRTEPPADVKALTDNILSRFKKG